MSGPIDVFMVAGQSNAQGSAPDNTLSPATVAGLAYERTTAGVLKQLADPVGNANVGSAWPAFVNALTAASGVPACISSRAQGGSYLIDWPGTTTGTHWAVGSSNYSASVSAGLATMTQLTSAGWTPNLRGVLWCQGESDGTKAGVSPTLQADYAAALIALHERYKVSMSKPTLKFYVFRTGTSVPYAAGFGLIRAAQDDACAAQAGMEMVFTKADTFRPLGWMSDDLHYTQQGYNLMGTEGGTNVSYDLGYATPPPDPDPDPVPVVRSSLLAQRLLMA